MSTHTESPLRALSESPLKALMPSVPSPYRFLDLSNLNYNPAWAIEGTGGGPGHTDFLYYGNITSLPIPNSHGVSVNTAYATLADLNTLGAVDIAPAYFYGWWTGPGGGTDFVFLARRRCPPALATYYLDHIAAMPDITGMVIISLGLLYGVRAPIAIGLDWVTYVPELSIGVQKGYGLWSIGSPGGGPDPNIVQPVTRRTCKGICMFPCAGSTGMNLSRWLLPGYVTIHTQVGANLSAPVADYTFPVPFDYTTLADNFTNWRNGPGWKRDVFFAHPDRVMIYWPMLRPGQLPTADFDPRASIWNLLRIADDD